MARKIRKGRNEAVVFEKAQAPEAAEPTQMQPGPTSISDMFVLGKKRGRPRKNAPAGVDAPATAATVATTAPEDVETAELAQDAAPAPTAAHGPTLGALCEGWLKHLEEIGKSRGTVFGYSIDLGIATKHFGADTSAGSITGATVQAFFESEAVTQTKSGRAKAKPTIDKTRRAFRLALTWAAESGLITSLPLPEANS